MFCGIIMCYYDLKSNGQIFNFIKIGKSLFGGVKTELQGKLFLFIII